MRDCIMLVVIYGNVCQGQIRMHANLAASLGLSAFAPRYTSLPVTLLSPLQVHNDLTKLGGDVQSLTQQQTICSEGIFHLVGYAPLIC